MMKNVQVIDAAENCTYSIFQFTDEQFLMIFPQQGQDIVFADELKDYLTEHEQIVAFAEVWERPIHKPDICGLHGTIFYGFEDRKACFPQTRREIDWSGHSLNVTQRKLFAQLRAKSN